jgi:type IV pilus assembly protein PilA
MSHHMRRGSGAENGFTLVELLVAILIAGLLVAIAIPSLLGQRNQAADASAKALARTAETTAETSYVIDHEGTYEAMTAAALKLYEPTIQTAPGNGNPYLSAVTVEPGELGYVVTAKATDGHTFSIEKKADGRVSRTCTPAGKRGAEGGGCQNSAW